ncbi:MAG: hypothetical protein U9R03_03650 [Candidatus Aerophobetes bacterium]|nr:hypothetical protein [Candidatus Aerophobetes bacterium]
MMVKMGGNSKPEQNKNDGEVGGLIAHHPLALLISKLGQNINEIFTFYRRRAIGLSAKIEGRANTFSPLNPIKWANEVSPLNPIKWANEVSPLWIDKILNALLTHKNKRIILYFLYRHGFGWHKLFSNNFGMGYTAKNLLSEFEIEGIIETCQNKDKELAKYMASEWHFKEAVIYKLTDKAFAFLKEISPQNWNLDLATIEKIENWKSDAKQFSEHNHINKVEDGITIPIEKPNIKNVYIVLDKIASERRESNPNNPKKWKIGYETTATSILPKKLSITEKVARNSLKSLSKMGYIKVKNKQIMVKPLNEILKERGKK